jgi:hypothetical protein
MASLLCRSSLPRPGRLPTAHKRLLHATVQTQQETPPKRSEQRGESNDDLVRRLIVSGPKAMVPYLRDKYKRDFFLPGTEFPWSRKAPKPRYLLQAFQRRDERYEQTHIPLFMGRWKQAFSRWIGFGILAQLTGASIETDLVRGAVQSAGILCNLLTAVQQSPGKSLITDAVILPERLLQRPDALLQSAMDGKDDADAVDDASVAVGADDTPVEMLAASLMTPELLSLFQDGLDALQKDKSPATINIEKILQTPSIHDTRVMAEASVIAGSGGDVSVLHHRFEFIPAEESQGLRAIQFEVDVQIPARLCVVVNNESTLVDRSVMVTLRSNRRRASLTGTEFSVKDDLAWSWTLADFDYLLASRLAHKKTLTHWERLLARNAMADSNNNE